MSGGQAAHTECARNFFYTSVFFFFFFYSMFFLFFFSFCARYGLLFYIKSMCCGSERPGDVEPHFSLLHSRFPKNQNQVSLPSSFIYILSLSFAFHEPSPFTTHRHRAAQSLTQHVSVFLPESSLGISELRRTFLRHLNFFL